MKLITRLLPLIVVFFTTGLKAQDSSAFQWTISSKKISDKQYEIVFSTQGNSQWQLYAPNQMLADVPTTEVQFPDSSIRVEKNIKDSGNATTANSPIFEIPVKFHSGPASFRTTLNIDGKVPARLSGVFLYTYGSNEEFYPSTTLNFTVNLEGGESSEARILVPGLDVKNPVNNCGDDDHTDKSLWMIFLLGFLGGLIALITPCVFPLIPLTVSFFTKKSGTRKKGVRNCRSCSLQQSGRPRRPSKTPSDTTLRKSRNGLTKIAC